MDLGSPPLSVMAMEDQRPSQSTTNGKSCHQCRQKTMDFGASCKAMKGNDKRCPLNYCHRCLENRYGENAEEVATLDAWICPKCRGICNCSLCRKKRGQNPTGILVHRARAVGLSSVSELLQVEGSDTFCYQRRPKLDIPIEGSSNSNTDSVSKTDVEVIDVVANEKDKVAEKMKKTKATKKLKEEAQLPQGTSLTNVLNIDIPIEETGNVLQFLEFCSAFGKALDLKEGQAESVVAELFSCGQQYSCVVSMMIQLLNLISHDRDMSLSLSETDNTWFNAVGEFILQSGLMSDVFPPETFESGVSEYEKMDASRRLKLLNFLCDESLGTSAMRDCIDNTSTESETMKREARERASAAMEKEKQLLQKMQDDIVKALMEKNGAPLTIEEHQAIVSQTQAEAKEAHDEMLEAKGLISKNSQICDVLRTEPILLDDNGLLLWKLKCFEEEQQFLLQDVGTYDDSTPHEKWSAFKPEQKQDIEKYVSVNKKKQKRAQKNANVEID